jgi:hypothetical protein
MAATASRIPCLPHNSFPPQLVDGEIRTRSSSRFEHNYAGWLKVPGIFGKGRSAGTSPVEQHADRSQVLDKVRIFVFDQKQWRADWPQLSKLTPCRPHSSILEFIAIDNERLIPQQSVSSVTNIDDIETYIRSMKKGGNQYLRIIDLPLRQRAGVMRELSVMRNHRWIAVPWIGRGLRGIEREIFPVAESLRHRLLSGPCRPARLCDHLSECLIFSVPSHCAFPQ